MESPGTQDVCLQAQSSDFLVIPGVDWCYILSSISEKEGERLVQKHLTSESLAHPQSLTVPHCLQSEFRMSSPETFAGGF